MLQIAFIGTSEILVAVAIIFILFGASRIPEISKSIANSIKAFRNALNAKDDDQEDRDKDKHEP